MTELLKNWTCHKLNVLITGPGLMNIIISGTSADHDNDNDILIKCSE
jgi:hypothetical protein